MTRLAGIWPGMLGLRPILEQDMDCCCEMLRLSVDSNGYVRVVSTCTRRLQRFPASALVAKDGDMFSHQPRSAILSAIRSLFHQHPCQKVLWSSQYLLSTQKRHLYILSSAHSLRAQLPSPSTHDDPATRATNKRASRYWTRC